MRLNALVHILLRDHLTMGQMEELIDKVSTQVMRKEHFPHASQEQYVEEIVRFLQGPCNCKTADEHRQRVADNGTRAELVGCLQIQEPDLQEAMLRDARREMADNGTRAELVGCRQITKREELENDMLVAVRAAKDYR